MSGSLNVRPAVVAQWYSTNPTTKRSWVQIPSGAGLYSLHLPISRVPHRCAALQIFPKNMLTHADLAKILQYRPEATNAPNLVHPVERTRGPNVRWRQGLRSPGN